DPAKEQTIRWQSEILFYRYSEIRRRAARVNFMLHPDLVLCLHLNAEGWGDPNSPTLTDMNHLHLLVNGSYLAEELEFDDERFEWSGGLVSRGYDEGLPLADPIALKMAGETVCRRTRIRPLTARPRSARAVTSMRAICWPRVFTAARSCTVSHT